MMQNRIPWLRIIAEGTAIVVSILLAFAIDAWWGGVVERRHEERILVGLRSDFLAVRAAVDRSRAGHERIVAAAQRLLTLTGPGRAGTPVPAADSLLASLLTGAPRFVPAQGALSALLNSDGLSAIADRELQALLSEWPRYVANVQRAETNGQTLMLDVFSPYLYPRVAIRSLDVIANPDLAAATSLFPTGSHLLLADLTFENLVNERLYFAFHATRALHEADSAAVGILRRIDARARR